MSMGWGGTFHGFTAGMGFELTRRVIVPAILVATPLFLWWWLGPERPTCDAERKAVATAAMAAVGERIQALRGDERRAVVLHFENDPTDVVTGALRKRLMSWGGLDLDGTPSNEKIRALLNLRNEGAFDGEAALAYGRKEGLDAVIIGQVVDFENVQGRAVLNGSVKFIRVKTGEVIELPMGGDASGAGGSADGGAQVSVWRLALTLVAILLLPWLGFGVLRAAMRRDSNLATAGVLLLLVALDALGLSLAFGALGSFWRLASFLVLLAMALGYDLFMLSYAQLCVKKLPRV